MLHTLVCASSRVVVAVVSRFGRFEVGVDDIKTGGGGLPCLLDSEAEISLSCMLLLNLELATLIGMIRV